MHSKNKIIILGGHGDGEVAAQVIFDAEKSGQLIELVGFLNDSMTSKETIFNLPVLGVLDSWKKLDDSFFFLPVIQKIKKMPSRHQRITNLKIPLDRMATVIHPTACIASNVTVGRGTLITSHVTVQPGAKIGNFVSIRAGANLGHDTIVEDFCYIGPNATMCGRSELGQGASLGPNAVILDRIRVEDYSIVGIGSAVTKNFISFNILSGNPARKLRSYRDMDIHP